MNTHSRPRPGPRTDQQPWLLASVAMGALVTVSFATVAGAMSGVSQGRMIAPIVTAGWTPSASPVPQGPDMRPMPPASDAQANAARGGPAKAAATPAPKLQRKPAIHTVAQHETIEAERAVVSPETPGAQYALAALGEGTALPVLADDPPPATPELDGFVGDPDPVVTPLTADAADEADDPDVQTVRFERGDTLKGVLAEAGVQPGDIASILDSLKKRIDPAALRAGQTLTLTFGKNPQHGAARGAPILIALGVRPTIEREVVVERQDNGRYASSEKVIQLTEKTDRVQGVIRGSLYQTALNAGVPEGAIAELIRIYSYDVDFQRDIQAGDKFDVLFTRYYDDQGAPVKLGTVLHATLTLQGERKPLYRFKAGDDQASDYFNPQGRNGKRFLMKTPIDGARLSSGFGMRRHPILGYNKLHKGTDFAAPTGTPIMASGSGVVEVAGIAGGYGKYVRLRHEGVYKTSYGHMSRFARGIKAGVKVRQGQIIGYVGTTGRSTGPHLHYEVLANNKHVDSQSVKLPTGVALDAKAMAAFQVERARIDDLLRNTPVMNNVASRDADVARP